MLPHPFTSSPTAIALTLLHILLAALLQGSLLLLYGHLPPAAALADAALFTGPLAVCGILSWFFFTHIRAWQAQMAITLLVQAICLGISYTALSLTQAESSAVFISLLPLRLTTGILYWTVLMQTYHILHIKKEMQPEDKKEEETPPPAAEPAGHLEQISVKDGLRIHLVRIHELLYIQACGDYVTLFTAAGQYVKEQTMKYFDTHLPPTSFVRIHRSTIVNTHHIMRVELFGKESYCVRLKNGTSLRVSSAGYKLLKERLHL